jgi:hypothetical protein
MPVKRHLVTDAHVDLLRFLHDDGVGPHRYLRTPGYATPEQARAAWRRHRRDVWLVCHRLHVPVAAKVYDEFTTDGWLELRRTVMFQVFQLDPVLEALDADEATVTAFERREPAGAATIADCLDLWRADLQMMRSLAVEAGSHADDMIMRSTLGIAARTTSKWCYGDASQRVRRVHDEGA